jgi:hypothetical protein
MLTVHPMDRPPAPLPLNDVYNSTTLIPYLENLYDEFYQDDDTVGTYGMYSPIRSTARGKIWETAWYILF